MNNKNWRKVKKNRQTKDHKYGNILKIPLNSKPRAGVLRDIQEILYKARDGNKVGKYFCINTPNPEIVNMGLGDLGLLKILQNSNLNIVDGVGLAQAIIFLSLPRTKYRLVAPFYYFIQGIYVGARSVVDKNWLEGIIPIIKGREFFMDLIRIANKKGMKVVLLGDKSVVRAKENLKSSFPKVKFLSLEGPWLDYSAKPIDKAQQAIERNVIGEISSFAPEMLFVGFGAPKQEKWVFKHKNRLNASIIMCVGRTFEWVSGVVPTAPKFMANLGLEWMYRLFTGSTSLVRILNAVIVFPLRVYLYKLQRNT